MTDELLADLRRDEGWCEHVYPDHLGFQTIGYGFLVDKRRGVGLPRPVAEFWLRYAVNERLAEFGKLWPGLGAQPADVQRAVSNMIYQLGPSGVAGFKNMLKALERGDRREAAAHARDSKWHREDTPERAERVCRLIEGSP